MKKTLTKLLAGALALSMMAVPALAAPSDSIEAFDVEGSVVAPAIKVEVATGYKIIVNPYQLNVTIADGTEADSAASDGTTSAASIISKPVYITNSGTTAVEVSVIATGKTSDAKAITFATAPLTAKDTTKKVYLYMMTGLAEATDGTKDPEEWNNTAGDGYRAYDKTKDVLIAAKASASKVAFTLAKDGTDFEAGKASTIGAITVAGEACGNSAEAWTADDTVSVGYAFTLRPTVIPEAA